MYIEDYFSIPARRERALRFCYGYYCMTASDEVGSVENGLGMLCDSRPLDSQEREEIVKLIEENPKIREHYIYRFKEESRSLF